tara:strand:- start:7889 stop:11179 length:3291 start_codon:yes stop_codon:yes gene_type:complete
MDVPSGNTASRPGSPATGSIYFDTDEASLVAYDGSAWSSVGGGAVDQSDLLADSNGSWTIDWFDKRGSNFFCRNRCCCDNTTCHGPYPSKMQPGTIGCNTGIRSFLGGSQATTTTISLITDVSNICGTSCRLNRYNCIDTPFGTTAMGGFYQCSFVGFGYNNVECHCSTECTVPFRVFQTGESELVHISTTCPYGAGPKKLSSVCLPTILAETFFSTGNKASQKFKVQTGPTCTAAAPCCVIDFQGDLVPTYLTSRPHGPIPWIDRKLCIHARASCGFKEQAFFTATSDTYGTNNPEVCCWAGFMTNATACFTDVGTGAHSEFLGVLTAPCMRLHCIPGVASSCWWQQLGFCINPSTPTNFCFNKLNCYFKHVSVFSKRTDIVGGGNLNNREKFDEVVCTYDDGLKLKRAGHSCGGSFLLSKTSKGYNCQNLCCGFYEYFFSPNGCCIIAQTNECTHNTSFCACKVECCSSTPICNASMSLPVTTIINRVTGTIKCVYAGCCIPLDDWDACIGRTKSCTTPMSANAYSTYRCYSGCLVLRNLGRMNTVLETGHCCLSNMPNHINFVGATNTYDNSFLMFSSDNTKSYGLGAAANLSDIGLVEFDHSLGRMYKTRNIGKALCDSLKVMATLSAPESNCATNQYKSCLASFSSACTVPCTYASITASTGCCCVSILQKCLGYNLTDPANACLTAVISPDPKKHLVNCYNTVFINPTNDHLVYIASVGRCCTNCYCAGWVGAICYDIENNCVSKVNTLWPPTEVAQQFFCTCYEQSQNNHKSVWYPFLPCFMCMGCTNKCGWSHGISATHYGNYQTYIASGSSDKGGFYLVKQGMKDLDVTVFNASNLNGNCCYFGCGTAGTGRCVKGCRTGSEGAMQVDQSTTVQKVPYTTPLECVGWRSEPAFACILNSIVSPVGSPNPISDGAAGTVGFCYRVCKACLDNSMLSPCVPQIGSQPCCDVKAGACNVATAKMWGIKNTDDICISFCYSGSCCAGPYKICDILKGTSGDSCVTALLYGSTTTYQKRYTIYDNILPCHLDCCETSKRYVSRFMSNVERVKPVEVYSGSGPFYRCYISRTPGQNLHEGFLKLYNESILCCC